MARSASGLAPPARSPKPVGRDRLASIAVFLAFIWARAARQLLGALALLLMVSLSESLSLLLIVPVIGLLTPGRTTLNLTAPARLVRLLHLPPVLHIELVLALVGFVLLIMIRSIAVRAKELQVTAMLYRIVNDLRTQLFSAMSRSRWSFISELRQSDLTHALTADMDRVQTATMQLLMFMQAIIMVAVYGMLSLLISLPMTAFAVGLGLLVLVVLAPLRVRARRHGEAFVSARKRQFATVDEFLVAMKMVKAANAEASYVARLSSELEDLRDQIIRYTRVSTLAAMIFQIVTAIAVALFVATGFVVLRLSREMMVTLLFLFMRLAPRIMGLQQETQDLLVNLSSFGTMQDLESRCRLHEEPTSPVARVRLAEAIRLDGVSYRYAQAERDALSDVTASIPAGCITALVAASGGGKSTLADLLLGLTEPARGGIYIDDARLTSQTLRAWRDEVAYVPQEVFLLNDTLAVNLRLTAPGASDDDLWRVLAAARLSEVVRHSPRGLGTLIGDRGVRLSGGERQRLAIARALLRRPQLLILDEATSALDHDNQSAIAQVIEALRGRLTVVTIAHRPSMIRFADWVIVLEEGRVVEAGDVGRLRCDPNSRLSRLLASEPS